MRSRLPRCDSGRVRSSVPDSPLPAYATGRPARTLSSTFRPGKQANVLKRAGDAGRGDLVRLEADQVPRIELHLPVAGAIDAGEQIEHRRLAGTVRTDQAVQRARRQLIEKFCTAFKPPNEMPMPSTFEQRLIGRRRGSRRADHVDCDGEAS